MFSRHPRFSMSRLALAALFSSALCLGLPTIGNCQDKKPTKPKTPPPPAKPKPPRAKPPHAPTPVGHTGSNGKGTPNAAEVAKHEAEKAKHDAEKAKRDAARAAREVVKFKQAEMLREAYVLAAIANHDYDGHRAKAMIHLELAVKQLEAGVAKNGSPKTKMMTRFEDARAARNIGPRPVVHEAQLVSDLQMRNAAKVLEIALPGAIELKEQGVAFHVERAIKEIAIALTKN